MGREPGAHMAGYQKRPVRRGRGTSWGRRIRRALGYVTLLVLLTLIGGLVFLTGVFYSVARDLPSPEQLVDYDPGGVTEVYATDKDPKTGKNVLLGRFFVENREFVPITKISKHLIDATIAIEDERFYQHPGVDLKALARMVYVNALNRRYEQGGSTLTQQLARNIYLTRRKTISRKAQEMMLALQIEKNFSKEEILERYLNEVFYGSGAYGVQAAAKVYFGRPVQALSLSQAALLAGLPQMPGRISPYDNKKAAIARRNVVLAKMRDLGYITPQQAKVAQSNGVFLAGEKPKGQADFKAPYFVEFVKRQLLDKYGYDKVFRGGLKVYTTLNWKMQQAAEQALRNGVAAAAGQRVTEGALVCVEPRTGYIRALVGGVDYARNKFNNAVQGRRQPGSAFKVFVYAAAFDTQRYDPYDRVPDLPRTFGGKYRPQNYGGGYHGWVTIRQALTHSYNIPAVYVANEIGPRRVIEYARKMGIVSLLEPNLSLALGAYPVSPLEMASAYAVLANGGNRTLPMGVIRVLNHEGETLEENPPQVEHAVIGETTVAQLSDILGDVVARGTAAGAKGIHEISNAHGKTGTTNDNRDAWFVGYTPELCAAVWVCGAQWVKQGDTAIVSRYRPMSGVTGGRVCAPIWARFMKTAVVIQRTSGEPKPSTPERVAVGTVAPALRRPSQANDTGYETIAPEPVVDIRIPPRAAARRDSAAPVGTDANLPISRGASPGLPAPAATTESAAAPPTVPPAPLAASSPSAARPPSPASRTAPPVTRTEPLPPPAASAPGPSAERVAARGIRAAAVSSFSSSAPEAATPAVVVPRAPRMVTVSVCVDSGQRATRWCPETVSRTLAASRAPGRRCRQHGPRPGDG